MKPGDKLRIKAGEEGGWLLDLLAQEKPMYTSYTRKWSIRLFAGVAHYIAPNYHHGKLVDYMVYAYTEEEAQRIIDQDMLEEVRWEKFQSYAEDQDDDYEPADADYAEEW